MKTQLDDIQARARAFADAREKLSELVSALNLGLEALKRDNLPAIRRQVNRCAELQAQLQALIEDAPEHFVKPKTLVFHGIKCGFGKGRGTITWEDDDQVVALVEKKLPELADVLIKTTKKPLKKALQQLTVDQLKKVGCAVEETGDVVIVHAVDSAVEKLVTALLKGIVTEEEQEQEA